MLELSHSSAVAMPRPSHAALADSAEMIRMRGQLITVLFGIALVLNVIVVLPLHAAMQIPADRGLTALFKWAPFDVVASVIYIVLGVKGFRCSVQLGRPAPVAAVLPLGVMAIVANWLMLALA